MRTHIGQARRVLVRRAFKKSVGAWEWSGRRYVCQAMPGALIIEESEYLRLTLDMQTGEVYAEVKG